MKCPSCQEGHPRARCSGDEIGPVSSGLESQARTSYKFLGVQETVRQDEKMALERATNVHLRRLSMIWSSPLSHINRIRASYQFAMPVLNYLM